MASVRFHGGLDGERPTPSTIEHVHVVLAIAVKWSVLTYNRAAAAKPKKAPSTVIHSFSRDELQQLLDLAAELEPRWLALCDLLSTTRMRVNEALGLLVGVDEPFEHA